jgi:hypothetical protein
MFLQVVPGVTWDGGVRAVSLTLGDYWDLDEAAWLATNRTMRYVHGLRTLLCRNEVWLFTRTLWGFLLALFYLLA